MSTQFKAIRTLIIFVWLYFVFNIRRGYVTLDLIYELMLFAVGLAVIWFGSKKLFNI